MKHSLVRLRLLRGAGILLVVLGLVHLVATPHIATLVRDSASPASARWLTPPMLLNHILVGVLLIPLGYLTTYAAPYAVNGASWAQVVGTNHRALDCDLAGRSLRADGDALLFCRATLCPRRSSDRYCGHYIVGCCIRPMSLAHQASNEAMPSLAKARRGMQPRKRPG